jgi:hypothetical protein
MNGTRAWATAIVMAVLVLVFCGAAYAAPTRNVPNSVASHNCVAATSGVLYYREHGIHLGQDVGEFAPHGRQRDFVLEALRKPC